MVGNVKGNSTDGCDFSKMQKRLMSEYPEQMKAFFGLVRVCEDDGVLSHKTKELISVALAVKAQCGACIIAHVRGAVDAGATRAEIMESAWVAVLMGGGPSYSYMMEVVKALDALGAK